ncbi:MAG: flagellar hook-associated protein FlgK [Elusimicrobiota bacterium]
MSLFSTLIMGARSLKAFQAAIQTTSHNISNANTPGYSRQRAILSTVQPDQTDAFLFGRGVQLEGIERLRLGFLDKQLRVETAGLGATDAKMTTYQLMESIFQEPSDQGLSAALNKFWNAWQELSNDPPSLPLRANLRANAANLSSAFNRLNTGLNGLKQSLNEDVKSEVTQINNLGANLADLNKQIRTFIFRGENPVDLLDQRDLILDQLSQKLNISVIDKGAGQMNVHVEGTLLVDENGFHSLKTAPRIGDTLGLVDVQWKETNNLVDLRSGSLSGLIESRDQIIPGYLNQLHEIASGMMSQINTIHGQGMGIDGTRKIMGALPFTSTLLSNQSLGINGINISLFSGDGLIDIVGRINAATITTGVEASIENNRLVLKPSITNPQTIQITSDTGGVTKLLGIKGDFFSGTNASDMRVSDAVLSDLNFIAASQTGAPGDNNNARAISHLKDALTLQGNTIGFNQYYRLMMTNLGSESQSVGFDQSNQKKILEQMDNTRESVSGVSLDEEMTDLIKYQRSYEMAAKVIQTADEMLAKLLEIA